MLYNTYAFYTWFPWLNFFSEVAILQTLFFFSLYSLFFSKNIFYSLINFLFFVILSGVFLCYFNLEFLSGFLWVAEFTILFIFILFFFFLNQTGSFYKKKNFFFSNFVLLIVFVTFWIFCTFFFEPFFDLLNLYFFWDNFFQSKFFLVLNDIHGFFLSYYIFNGFIFFIFGFLILLTSIVCINLLKAIKSNIYTFINNSLNILKYVEDFISFDFLRKQDVFKQNLRKPVNYMHTRKKKEWSKKEPN